MIVLSRNIVFSLVGITVCAVLSVFITVSTSNSARMEYSDRSLHESTVNSIITVGDQIDPVFLDVFPPSLTNQAASSFSPPPELVDSILSSINEAVKPEWLAGDLRQLLVGVKDVVKWEWRDANGVVFSREIVDYVMADYQIEGYKVLIQENGTSISLRVDLPQADSMLLRPEAMFREYINRILKYPEDGHNRSEFDIQRQDGLYYGRLVTETDSAEFTSGDSNAAQWWQELRLCSDGHFFFVSFLEQSEHPKNPTPRIGPIDRF